VENFSKSTVVHTKMGHVSKSTPLFGVICHPFVENFRALASAIPEIWMGSPNFKPSRDVTTPLSWTVCRPSAGNSYD